MNIFTLITLSGPVLGVAGWLFNVQWLIWFGVALATVNLIMNIASGAMKLPIFPVVIMVITAFLVDPWYLGVGFGLLIWTAIEGAGELFVGITRKLG